MDPTPIYIIVRDTDIDALTDAVNERIDEGYELAGQLLFVPGRDGEAPTYLQPMTLAAAEEAEEDDEEQEEENDEDDEAEEIEEDAGEDVVVYRRKR